MFFVQNGHRNPKFLSVRRHTSASATNKPNRFAAPWAGLLRMVAKRKMFLPGKDLDIHKYGEREEALPVGEFLMNSIKK